MKTIDQINEKIRKKQAVVVTAEEMIDIVEERGTEKAAREVDVVTTGTFGPMCSSGALINAGHSTPRMKITGAKLNNVPAYSGIAAIDMYIGATEMAEDDPCNKVFPGEFQYGGAHVIEDLVRGEDVRLEAWAYGTDCYPRRRLETHINIRDLNSATLLNPRNAYQNYNVGVNANADRPIYTYMGILLPNMANANYCSAGQLSPLLNDPHYRTIGIGTRIFLAGTTGYVFYAGTQHNPSEGRGENGVPTGGAGTVSVIGDLKAMSHKYLRAASITGYGVSLAVGIGVPIPILDEDMARFTAVKDSEIFAPVMDYAKDYPYNENGPITRVSYADLKSGVITINGKVIRTASLSSYSKALEIATELKRSIEKGEFELTRPAELLPGVESGVEFRPLRYRPIKKQTRTWKRW